MSNRPAGGARSKQWERAPFDWYRESPRVVEQLFHGVNFTTSAGPDLIYDPCCGTGNVLDVARRFGHPTFGSDVVDRNARHRFVKGNVLTQIARAPKEEGRATSIVCNPPYSYQPEIAERIITHCLESFEVRRAAFILPIAFVASQERWGPRRLLRWRPSHLCIYRERHTMPPGHLIDEMVSPFAGGMADYVALVWTRPHRWRTETVWLAPGHHPDPPRWANKEIENNG
jgi:hypothetical protein